MNDKAIFPDAPLTVDELHWAPQGEPVTESWFWFDVEKTETVRVRVKARNDVEAEDQVRNGDLYASELIESSVASVVCLGPVTP